MVPQRIPSDPGARAAGGSEWPRSAKRENERRGHPPPAGTSLLTKSRGGHEPGQIEVGLGQGHQPGVVPRLVGLNRIQR